MLVCSIEMDSTSFLGQDLDEDCFIPSSGASLANIFGSQITKSTTAANKLLKYTAPKSPDVKKAKEELRPDDVEPVQRHTGNKSSECVMAKVVHAHELINGVYETRGKLGLAILRMLTPPHTKVVLFNSAKSTLSSVVASEYLEVTIQNNNYITYYDETAKNWSVLFSNSQDLSDITEEFKKHNVKINEYIPNPSYSKNISDVNTTGQIESKDTCNQADVSSDDATKTKQAKLALLNRMAMMGQAILPPRQISSDRTSDSSDDNVPPREKPPAPPRHKGIKPTSIVRKVGKAAIAESCDSSHNMETVRVSSVVPVSNTSVMQPTALFTYVNGQIVPIPGNDNTDSTLNIFLSETRMSNTEIRINVNRIADKVDQVLDKLKSVENRQVSLPSTNDSSTNFNMEIFHKLLREYEDKIRIKDDLIRSLEEKLLTAQKIYTPDEVSSANTVKLAELLKTHEDLKHSIAIKNDEIEQLKQNIEKLENECRSLRENCDKSENLRGENEKLVEKIMNMQFDLQAKDRKTEELNQAHNKICEQFEKIKLENNQLVEELVVKKQKLINTSHDIDVETKIKKIMNNTFRALAANFENDASYSGNDIKRVIASVIKQTTLESLQFTET